MQSRLIPFRKIPNTLFAAVLLLGLYAQLVFSSVRKSAIFDETFHLVAGYAYAKTGTRQLVHEVLPAGGYLVYAPLWLLQRPLSIPPEQLLSGDFSASRYFWVNEPDPVQAISISRWGVMWVALLCAALVFRFGADLWGRSGGLFVFILAITDPNLIGNGRVATRDLLLATLALAAAWLLWRGVRRGRNLYALLAGLFIGLAAVTKFSAALLVPMLALMVLLMPQRRDGFVLRSKLRILSIVAGAAFLTWWAVYRFEFREVTGLGWPLPAAYFWEGALSFAGRINRGTTAFLLGEQSPDGWWYFFPLTLLFKTPIPLLLAVAIGSGSALRASRTARAKIIALATPALLYLVVAASGNLSIGYRHLLPILPFLLVLAGSVLRLQSSRLNGRVLTSVFAGWAVLNVFWTFPNHLSYFNAIAGGPANGYRVLVDSSLDWGQDLPALREWLDANQVDEINLSYFGTALPGNYGVNAQMLPGFINTVSGPEVMAFNPHSPEPGWYAISATSLQLGLVDEQHNLFAFFREREPVGRAGHSILIYNLQYPQETPHDRVVVSGQRISDLSPDKLGIQPGEFTLAKWSTSDGLVLAGSGQARYVGSLEGMLSTTPDDVLEVEGLFDARRIIFSIESDADLCRSFLTPAGFAMSDPIPNTAGLELVAVDVRPAGATLDVFSYWKVNAEVATPLVQFIHAWDAAGELHAQADGWHVAERGLEIGDLVVNRARLILGDETELQLQLGLYSPATLERFAFTLSDSETTDRLILDC